MHIDRPLAGTSLDSSGWYTHVSLVHANCMWMALDCLGDPTGWTINATECATWQPSRTPESVLNSCIGLCELHLSGLDLPLGYHWRYRDERCVWLAQFYPWIQ